MSYNFLDKTGLTYFYDKIKTIFAKKSEIPTKTSQLTNDNYFNYSIEKPSGTIDALAAFTSGKPGITGSISLTKKSSGIGSEIPAGWYNYYFAPHRTGVGGDNGQYGTILLTPMNFAGKSWILRRSSSTNVITEVKAIITSDDMSSKTDSSILPNDSGEIKTKYRISNKNYTGSGNPSWYYKLCKLPTDGNGNYASAIISGRIGGWVSANMSYINALAWNRSGTGIALIDIAGTAGNMSSIWGTCDIVIYTDAETVSTTQNDDGVDTVYLKCNGYFTFDLDLEMFQSYSEILYDGTYITTEPTGTLVAKASTSTKRLELVNGKLLVSGSQAVTVASGTATRATGDKNGNDITTTYYKASNPSGYTSNTGTVTSVAVKMNNTTKGTVTTSGTIDLGTVITSHQSLADRAVNKTLTNENLNNVTTPGFYNAGGGNTCTNKPSGVDHFGLYVVHGASGSYYTQKLFTDATQYTRKCGNGTWGSWSEDKLTDTTYSNKTAASGGTDVSLVTTGDKYNWNSKTSNTGTVTSVAVKMNNTTKGTVTTSGTIDLGTVITSHQDISGKQDKLATQTAYTSKGSATKVPQITTNTLGQVTGISEVTISQPTVNNGTLTIQKNGTNVQTFSANQSGNATANITVPTKVSDLNNDSNFTSKMYVDNAVVTNRGAENPIATILAYAGSEAPNGYLLCRGQAVSRTTYSLLFNAIGTQYGSGDGSTTFNIPDLQGKVIAGLDIVDEDFNVLGKTGGAKTVQLTKNQLPKINGNFTMHGGGSATPVASVTGDFSTTLNNNKYKNGGTSDISGAKSVGNVILNIGNNEAHENKQPYNTLNYIIKAYSGTDVPIPVDMSSVKNVYDNSTSNVYSTEYVNTKVRGKKLWTNPNPNSNFAAQTISFDGTNDYDFYKIKVKYGTDESYAYNWQDVEVGDTFSLLLMWSYTPGIADPNTKGYIATGFRPECSCNHSSITFTNAVYYTSADSTKLVNNTSHCIPLEIYGYYI